MRPRKDIDLDTVTEMAAEFCTQEEIAADMGFAVNNFNNRRDLLNAYRKGRGQAGISLRHYQFMRAKSGDSQVINAMMDRYGLYPPKEKPIEEMETPRIFDDIAIVMQEREQSNGDE